METILFITTILITVVCFPFLMTIVVLYNFIIPIVLIDLLTMIIMLKYKNYEMNRYGIKGIVFTLLAFLDMSHHWFSFLFKSNPSSGGFSLFPSKDSITETFLEISTSALFSIIGVISFILFFAKTIKYIKSKKINELPK